MSKRVPSRETSTCSPGFIFIMIKPGNYILLSSYSLKKKIKLKMEMPSTFKMMLSLRP